MNPSLPALIARLHAFSGIAHKRDIQQVARELRDAWPNPSPNGDDCALIPDGSGYKLLAIEGFINRFVAEDPWFAGWCGVMVNLSDIAAMGGRPLAVVNALWDEAQPHAAQILQGMAAASRAYQVPIVGGHTNLRSDRSQLAVAVLGETASPLSSSAAQAGQTLMVAINLQGRWHPPGNNWDAATRADPAELRRALALLPELAAEGSLCAAKDISQAGLAGTLTMMLESCGLGAEVTLEQIPIPAEIDLEQWLCAFPSFGFLLAVDEARCHEVAQRFAACGIACAVAGHFTREQKLILRYRVEEQTMPAMHFVVCWPDGSKETCYSPSTAIEKYLLVNHPYALNEFVQVTTRALDEASERVKAKFGYYCSSAQDQSAAIVQKAAQFSPEQRVTVEKITPITA